MRNQILPAAYKWGGAGIRGNRDMICPNCHKEFAEGAKFCDVCGAQLVEQIQPEAAPQPIEQSVQPEEVPQPEQPNIPQPEQAPTFEQQTPPVQTAYAPQPEWNAQPEQPNGQWNAPSGQWGAPAAPEKKSKKKFFLIGGIAAGVVAIAAVVVILLLNMGGSRSDYAIYLKDGEICYTDFTEKGRMELTDRLFSEGKPDASEMPYYGSTLSYRIAFSEDGNRVFYCDRGDANSGEFTLYFRDLSRPNIEPMKLDSGVQWSFAINSDGSEVFYRKTDGSLYRHNLTDKEKIANDTYDEFGVADDCRKIYYAANYSYDNGTFDIYLWKAGGEKIKLASDVSRMISATPDASTIYYLREGSIYRQVEGAADREKLVSDVYSVISGNDAGQMYYTRESKQDHTLAEFVIDDMAALDANATYPEYPVYPEYPEYPNWWEYDDDEQYSAAVDQWNIDYEYYQSECARLDSEYNDAVELYNQKQNRDMLREALASETVTLSSYTLYYFDGTTETELCSDYDSYWSMSSESPVLVYYRQDTADIARFNLTDITSTSEVWDAVMYPDTTGNYVLAVGATLSDMEEGTGFNVASDGSAIYYFTPQEETYDLWKLPISGGVIGTAEKKDSGVTVVGCGFVGDSFVYYKDMNESDSGYYGDLYIEGEAVDYDVRLWSVTLGGDGALYYYTDYNAERGMGTLMRYTGGNKEKIADDVCQYTANEKGDVLYLYDFSQNSYVGTLYRYSEGKAVKIDDDVATIIPVKSNVDKHYEMPAK